MGKYLLDRSATQLFMTLIYCQAKKITKVGIYFIGQMDRSYLFGYAMIYVIDLCNDL